jgi:hypothetical protein
MAGYSTLEKQPKIRGLEFTQIVATSLFWTAGLQLTAGVNTHW